MKNIPLLLITFGGSILLLLGVVWKFSSMASKPIDPTVILGNQTYATGSANPKVTIVEFSDFQCPACRASSFLVQEILTNNPDVKLVYRFFPLSFHANAQEAAEAAIAAGTFGKFWEYHDILFDKQKDWENEKDATAKFAEYAQSLGISQEDFIKKLEESKDTSRAIIVEDIQAGTRLGIPGTPTFFVDGVRTQVTDLQSVVDKSLQK